MVKQPGHLTSMKNDRGAGTSVLFVLALFECSNGYLTDLQLVLLGLSSRAGVEQINGENLSKNFVSITASGTS